MIPSPEHSRLPLSDLALRLSSGLIEPRWELARREQRRFPKRLARGHGLALPTAATSGASQNPAPRAVSPYATHLLADHLDLADEGLSRSGRWSDSPCARMEMAPASLVGHHARGRPPPDGDAFAHARVRSRISSPSMCAQSSDKCRLGGTCSPHSRRRRSASTMPDPAGSI
jgi:hypothetical protein